MGRGAVLRLSAGADGARRWAGWEVGVDPDALGWKGGCSCIDWARSCDCGDENALATADAGTDKVGLSLWLRRGGGEVARGWVELMRSGERGKPPAIGCGETRPLPPDERLE